MLIHLMNLLNKQQQLLRILTKWIKKIFLFLQYLHFILIRLKEYASTGIFEEEPDAEKVADLQNFIASLYI